MGPPFQGYQLMMYRVDITLSKQKGTNKTNWRATSNKWTTSWPYFLYFTLYMIVLY